MKICHVASTYPRHGGDGAGRFVQSMAEAQVDLGHTVHAIAPHHPVVQPYASPVKLHHFRYVWPDRAAIMGYAEAMHSDTRLHAAAYLLAPLFAASEFWLLHRLTQREQFDAIHAHWVIPNGFVAALVAQIHNIPLVISLHGSDIFMAQRRAIFQPIVRWTFRRAAAVTACGPDLYAGAVELGADPERTEVVPWGADPVVFGEPQELGPLRQQLGLVADQPVLLSLGRLVRKKGIDDLIRALPPLIERHPGLRCIIAGDGPEAAPLQRLARELGVHEQVHFVGNVRWDRVLQYFQLCTLFVASSIHDENGNADAMPTTLLEAMAAGRPIVATRVNGIPLVVDHGKTGLVVAERDPTQLAAAIGELLADPQRRASFGRAARQRVEQELNWHAVARKLVHMYGAQGQWGVA